MTKTLVTNFFNACTIVIYNFRVTPDLKFTLTTTLASNGFKIHNRLTPRRDVTFTKIDTLTSCRRGKMPYLPKSRGAKRNVQNLFSPSSPPSSSSSLACHGLIIFNTAPSSFRFPFLRAIFYFSLAPSSFRESASPASTASTSSPEPS